MMTLRARIFIIISLVVFFVLGITLLLIVNKKQTVGETQTVKEEGVLPVNGANTQTQINNLNGMQVKPLSGEEAEKKAVGQLAKIFVERYNTYSTDNDFQNIKEVEELCVESFWAKISVKMKVAPSESFKGVTTKVIGVEISDWQKTSAKVILQTAQTEEKDGVATATTYTNFEVSLTKVGDKWLVDGSVGK
ncbi:MAG: hypothetical protein PHY40_04360 [Patescibacteria group bacterium]|nr:hypothetical protein [Patescibacteria group bacterium]